jgi:hypothetical protein
MSARRGTVLRLLPPVPGDPELEEMLACVKRMYARRRRSEHAEDYWGHLRFQLPLLEEFSLDLDDDPDAGVEQPPERATAEQTEAAR